MDSHFPALIVINEMDENITSLNHEHVWEMGLDIISKEKLDYSWFILRWNLRDESDYKKLSYQDTITWPEVLYRLAISQRSVIFFKERELNTGTERPST